MRGLIVDTDDVLYDATLWPRRLVRLVHALGVPVDYPDFIGRWQRDYLFDVHCGRRDYGEALQAFLLAAGLSWAQIDELEAASGIERHKIEFAARPLPGVVQTFRRLCQHGTAVVAWADAPLTAGQVTQRLERLGLGGLFLAILSSFDLEAAQPMSGCYQAALDALGLAVHEVAYLGHDALHLAGAKSAGLRTIAFNFQSGATADFYLGGFDELAALFGCNRAEPATC
jgi:FMN phosphatase YigB (HAD superfamily)